MNLKQIVKSASDAVVEAYDHNVPFTRIEFENCIIFAATSYRSGVLIPRD